MGFSEQINDQETQLKIAHDCTDLIEQHVNRKKGVTGVAFKTLYKGLKSVSADYIVQANLKLLPSVTKALDPLWDEGKQKGDPVEYMKENKSLTADTILSVTDDKIGDAKNKIVKVSYSKVRKSLKGEIEEVIPDLASILQKYVEY